MWPCLANALSPVRPGRLSLCVAQLQRRRVPVLRTMATSRWKKTVEQNSKKRLRTEPSAGAMDAGGVGASGSSGGGSSGSLGDGAAPGESGGWGRLACRAMA